MLEKEIVDKAYRALPTSLIVEAFFQGTDSIRHFVVTVMEPILNGQLGLCDRQIAIVGTYYRIIGWLKAIGVLNSLPHYQGVAAGARSLYELLLDMKLIQSDTNGELVKMFHLFPQIEKYRAATNLVSYCDETNNKRIECAIQRTYIDQVKSEKGLESTIAEHWGVDKKGKPRWPTHWSGLSTIERAKKVGAKYVEMYYEFYPFLSWHIHSGSTGYTGLDQETLEKAFGLMHSTIQKVVLDATRSCAEEMKIDKIDNLDSHFASALDELSDATNQILVNKYEDSINHANR